MSITVTTLAESNSTTDGTSFATASISPSANKLILAFILGDRNANPAALPSLSGNGLTWVDVNNNNGDGGTVNHSLFRAMGASPSSGAVTIDWGAVTYQSCFWMIVQVDGIDTSGTNGSGAIVQSKVTNATSAAPTLAFDSATNANNAVLAHCWHAASTAAISGPTGWTNVQSRSVSSPSSYGRGGYFIGADDETDWSWTGSANYTIVQVEVKAASIVAPDPFVTVRFKAA